MDRARDLEMAAASIGSEPLERAKAAAAIGCQEYLRWTDAFAKGLEKVHTPQEIQRFAKAMALIQLACLPTRPEACPFCLQHSGDSSCRGCGYALTHGGRCDSDESAFSIFIEGFQELGRAILQDCEVGQDPDEGLEVLWEAIAGSAQAARWMLEDLAEASAGEFMERKARYLARMISLLPVCLLSEEVRARQREVQGRLMDYW
jgi:hypothetical protein